MPKQLPSANPAAGLARGTASSDAACLARPSAAPAQAFASTNASPIPTERASSTSEPVTSAVCSRRLGCPVRQHGPRAQVPAQAFPRSLFPVKGAVAVPADVRCDVHSMSVLCFLPPSSVSETRLSLSTPFLVDLFARQDMFLFRCHSFDSE